MSPTGFGSVPCERIEMLLDGERLSLVDWVGGGRQAAANCGPGRQAQRATAFGGQAGPEAFFGGRGGAPMRVRFKTTAGTHDVGATFLATNFAPLLDLDKHFMRDTLQTGPTPGYTFFPHVGTIRIEGPFEATQAADSPSRRKIFVCTPKTAAEETACARRIVTRLATSAYRRPATAADVDELMEFYDLRAQGEELRRRRRDGAGARAGVAAVPLPHRGRAGGGEGRPGVSHQRHRPRLAPVVLPLEHGARTRNCCASRRQGRLRTPAVLEQQVRRMLKSPKAEAMAENFAGQWLNLRGLDATSPLPLIYPGLRRPAAPGDAPRGGAAVRHHRARGPQHRRPADAPTTPSSTSGWPSTTASRTSPAASSAA